MLRTALILLGITVVGLALILFGGSRWTDAAGISLLVPGGGFLYDGWPILFVLTWALFWLGWNFWVGFGSVFHVAAAYLISIAGGIALADGPRLGLDSGTTWPWAIPVLLFGAALYVAHHVFSAVRGRKRDLALREERRAALAATDPGDLEAVVRSFDPPHLRPANKAFDPIAVVETDRGLEPPLPVTDGDAQLAKYFLDRSLQPVPSFDGWDWGKDAVEPNALRYQVVDMGSNLAFLQANYTPAYPSLVEKAQRNVIAKAQEIPVWGYWYFENFFGNLTRKTDPVGDTYENIMFTGFFIKQLAHYEAVSHDHRYDQPGSLRFTWEDGRTFAYSYPELAAHSAGGFAESTMGMWPCEPGQVYTVCNQYGAAGVQGFGSMHGTDEWTKVQGRYESLLEEEWMKLNGDVYGHFNLRLGMNVGSLTWNDGTSPMFMDGNQFLYMFGRTISPEIAARLYLMGQNHATMNYLPVVDGALQLPDMESEQGGSGFLKRLLIRFPSVKSFLSGAFVKMEKTGYPASNAVMYGAIGDLARQFGRDDVADAAVAGLDKIHLAVQPDGRPYAVTHSTLAMIARARWGRLFKEDDFLTARIPRYDGPLLASAPYPEVLVTYANGRDGVLCLTLEPAGTPGEFPLFFDRLNPSTDYWLRGTGIRFRTDSLGSGWATVPLGKRVTLLVEPATD
ncbi:linalool dehydratase/isomerase domain-containing protein [Gordonia terrae]